MFVSGRILDTSGQPIPNTTIEVWETDAEGFYDTQYTDRQEPDCRGGLRSQDDGSYAFRGIVPVAYPIPGDNLQDVTSDKEARAKGFESGPFKLLQKDFVLVRQEEAKIARAERAAKTVPDKAKVEC
ncbi:hypothetical protein FRC00_002278 [Tulasnella sp. 408]|nr:hypothetical protein FRC00_002278 [Tulasnella sp. 408]